MRVVLGVADSFLSTSSFSRLIEIHEGTAVELAIHLMGGCIHFQATPYKHGWCLASCKGYLHFDVDVESSG